MALATSLKIYTLLSVLKRCLPYPNIFFQPHSTAIQKGMKPGSLINMNRSHYLFHVQLPRSIALEQLSDCFSFGPVIFEIDIPHIENYRLSRECIQGITQTPKMTKIPSSNVQWISCIMGLTSNDPVQNLPFRHKAAVYALRSTPISTQQFHTPLVSVGRIMFQVFTS